jgi:hypothetical protein
MPKFLMAATTVKTASLERELAEQKKRFADTSALVLCFSS